MILLFLLLSCSDPSNITVAPETTGTVPVDQGPDSGFLDDTAG